MYVKVYCDKMTANVIVLYSKVATSFPSVLVNTKIISQGVFIQGVRIYCEKQYSEAVSMISKYTISR